MPVLDPLLRPPERFEGQARRRGEKKYAKAAGGWRGRAGEGAAAAGREETCAQTLEHVLNALTRMIGTLDVSAVAAAEEEEEEEAPLDSAPAPIADAADAADAADDAAEAAERRAQRLLTAAAMDMGLTTRTRAISEAEGHIKVPDSANAARRVLALLRQGELGPLCLDLRPPSLAAKRFGGSHTAAAKPKTKARRAREARAARV